MMRLNEGRKELVREMFKYTMAARRHVSARRRKPYGPTNQPTDERTHPLIESWLPTKKKD